MGKFWSTIGVVFFSGILMYIGILILLFFLQSRLIYYPMKGINVTPQSIGLSYESISLITKDWVTITGWFVPALNPKGVILFCHGNGGNISHRLQSLQIFYQLGLSTFIFDYRGYGKSDGKPTELGTYHDAEVAWDYLVETRKINPEKIIILGRSLGGAVAAYLAQKHPPKALILESTFPSIHEVANSLYPFIPARLLLRFHYPTLEYSQKVSCPILVVHSREDDLIPYSLGRQLFEGINVPKEFLEISGDHNEGFLLPESNYSQGLDAFLLSVFEGEKKILFE